MVRGYSRVIAPQFKGFIVQLSEGEAAQLFCSAKSEWCAAPDVLPAGTELAEGLGCTYRRLVSARPYAQRLRNSPAAGILRRSTHQ